MDIGTLALVTQWVGTLLMFGLFAFLWQSMRSPLLRDWTVSWMALTTSLLALTGAFRQPALRVPLEVVYFFGEYCFAFFLIEGCRRLAARQPSRQSPLWLAAGGVAAVVWSIVSDDFNIQFIPHAAVFASCFVVALRQLAPARVAGKSGGIKVLTLALLLLAFNFFIYVPAFAYAVEVGPDRQPSYLHYNSIVDLVLEVLLGFGMVMVMFDRLVQDVQSANVKLETRMRTDPLTDALNRHAYHALLGAPGQHRTMTGCVAIGDLDHLKAINDDRGHAAGDAAIRKVATALRSVIRADDLLFRWGGDEFLVVLWNVDEGEAGRRFELLDEAFHAAGLSVSFGLASFGAEQTLEQAIERADLLMYSKKKRRYNQADTLSPGP